MVDSIILRGLQTIHQGLQNAATSAEKLRKAFRPDSDEDEVSAIVQLHSAKREVQTGAKIIQVGDKMLGAVLDIIG